MTSTTNWRPRSLPKIGLIAGMAAFSAICPAPADDEVPPSAVETSTEKPDSAPAVSQGSIDTLDPMVVIGSPEAVFSLPGSGYYLSEEEIREFTYFSVNRMLAKVPGVYVREETGFGLFPNISIRGGDGTRSENITIMEDGILTAPAPYAAPAAYYSPNASRMSGLEILKGSSQVRYGPHTTGGVINYLSTMVPQEQTLYLKTTYGSDNTILTHGYYGDVIEGDFGRFGFLAEMFYKGTDGFRTIQPGIGYGGSDSTGFGLIEPMVKVFWEPNTAAYQRFEFKYGYTTLDANETYTGLSSGDLQNNPHDRYAGTYLDNMDTEQHRTYLKYLIEPSDNLTLQVAGYYNKFSRNWYKIRTSGGEGLHTVLGNTHKYSDEFDILRLRAPGELGIRANNRDYEAYGVQGIADYDFVTGALEHEVHLGARLHYDQIRRFQRDDDIVVGSPGNPLFVRTGEWGSGGNRHQEVDALSLWIEDRITWGNLSVIPGIRYEYADMSYTDYASDSTNTVTGSGSGSTDKVAPGVGFTYDLTPGETLFGGIYRGISNPGPRSFLRDGTDWEESIGYELGLRHRSDGLYGEIAGFFTDFSNLTGSDAGLGGADSTNAGAAEVFGVEFLASYDPFFEKPIGLPLFVSATYTDATLQSALSAGGGDDIYAGGFPGSRIPYIPEWKLAMGVGLDAELWGVDLIATYVSDSYGTARNVTSPIDSAREGLIDGGFTVDVAGHVKVTENLKLIGGVNNIFDETLTVSRIPEGPRVNAPRLFYVGFELDW